MCIRDRSKRLGLEDKVEFLGWVAGEEKSEAFLNADVLALPSYSEGMPNAILEGMASGLAIIATPVGGIPALLPSKDQGLFVDVANAEDIASAMKTLIEDRSLIVTMGKCNEQRALEYHDVHSVWPVVGEILVPEAMVQAT